MWIVSSAQVTEISTPGTKRMPSARAASAAWASPASSSWSVSASTVTPFAAARRDDLGRRERAVGDRRVAVEVEVAGFERAHRPGV